MYKSKISKIRNNFFDDKSTDNSLDKLYNFKYKNKIKLKIITNKKIIKTAPVNQMIGIKSG